jgi:hypothetical protein
MDFKPNDSSFHYIHDAWVVECDQLGIHTNTKSWQEFIKKCGLEHISIVNKLNFY